MKNNTSLHDIALLRALLADKDKRLNALEEEVCHLRQSLGDSESTVHTLRQSLSDSESTIQSLVEQLNLARRKRFGTSSETMPPQDLEFNEAENHANTDDIAEDAKRDCKQPSQNDKGNTSSESRRGRPKLLEDLPREHVVLDVPESDKVCTCCQSMLCQMGESTSEKLVYLPAKLYVEVIERPKYVCRQCDKQGEQNTVVMAAPAPSIIIIPKSFATPSLLAQIIANKYHYALPLYRQESLFGQYGIKLSRKTMSQWILKCAEKLEPLIALLKETLLAQEVLFADETTLTVLNDERKKSYIWLYGCGRYRGGDAQSPGIVLFDYQDGSRGHHCPASYLSDYGGYLHVDGYEAYEKTEAKLVGCWAHARRKFIEAEQSQPKGKQGKGGKIQLAITWFQKLYRIEQEIKDKPEAERHQQRQLKSLPLLKAFKAWLDKCATQVLPKSKLGVAINYSLNQWEKLRRVVDDGRLSLDNNRAERSVRPFTVGRNNWLFSNTHNGARASAVLYSLIETAKANDCEPYDYLEYVLREVPKLKYGDDHRHLLPWNMPQTEAPSS
ncbi:IS66 family transposase [Vibrio parahaemolyticus]|uniref:IS66 family transposase n=1 Tax=Vibrio parahaemolyticus TaxID=670 RepID=UPI0009AA93EB|nr:IS66 family transposase [Vibrio parahaemolyticus]